MAEETTPRWRFLRAVATIGSGGATALVGTKALTLSHAEAAPLPPVLAEPTGKLMVRMQRDLEATINSGATPSWLMVVDTRKCISCDACTVACRAENPTGPEGRFRRVVKKDLPMGPETVGYLQTGELFAVR